MSVPNQGGAVLAKGNFIVIVAGFPIGYFKAAKIPQAKIGRTEVKQAGAAVSRKYPSGMLEFDDAEFTMFQSSDGLTDAAVKAWLAQCANPKTGKASVPPQGAKRDVTVQQTDTDGSIVHEWILRGAFPLEAGDLDLEAGSSDPVERTLKLSVDFVEQLR